MKSRLFLLVSIVWLPLKLTLGQAEAASNDRLIFAQAAPAPAKPAAKAPAAPPAPAVTPAGSNGATPATPGTTAAPAASWATTCSNQANNQFNCEMTQSIVEQRTGNQIALISIKSANDGPSSAMLIRIFHGVYLPAGVAVKIDSAAPQQLSFQKSDRLGSYAALPLNEKLLGELKKGKELNLVVQVNQGEEFKIAGSLAGFGPAFDRLSSIKK